MKRWIWILIILLVVMPSYALAANIKYSDEYMDCTISISDFALNAAMHNVLTGKQDELKVEIKTSCTPKSSDLHTVRMAYFTASSSKFLHLKLIALNGDVYWEGDIHGVGDALTLLSFGSNSNLLEDPSYLKKILSNGHVTKDIPLSKEDAKKYKGEWKLIVYVNNNPNAKTEIPITGSFLIICGPGFVLVLSILMTTSGILKRREIIVLKGEGQ